MIADGIKALTKQTGGRKCSVCSHKEATEINKQIAQGQSFRVISRQILGDEKHHDSVRRHTQNCLKLDVAALVEQNRIERAVDYHREINQQLAFAKRLRIAAEEYLTDPDTGRISLDYHADEIEVFYTDASKIIQNGGSRKEKAKLQDLLDWITTKRPQIQPDKSELKRVDVRAFALDAIKTADLVLDKIIKIQGGYLKDNEQKNPVQVSQTPTELAVAMIAKFIADKLHEKGITINKMLYYAFEQVPDAEQEKVIEAVEVMVKQSDNPRLLMGLAENEQLDESV